MALSVAHAIIGTAGHIDHGKTALIRALTGQETDRLKEERERGISIDLGFAYFTLPDGTRAGVVDVPGHERFIRNMLAGAHGIDLVLFTVAADDGVMPQSEEHLDILHLLGLSRGIFVITKADLAGPARIAEVREEIALMAEETALADAPIIAVSTVTGQGLEDLRQEIGRQLEGFQSRRAGGVFRLPIDRAFVIKGRGVVVTGTALGATVRVGDRLRLLPAGGEVRVRGIQVHSEPVESAGYGQRVALNLTGAEKFQIERGDVLADERLTVTATRMDAWLNLRPAARRPLATNERVRVHLAAAERIARIIALESGGEVPLRDGGLAQLVMTEPLVALVGDRFVLRDETDQRTIGGGRVLNPLGRNVRRPLETYRARLATIRDRSGADVGEALIDIGESFAMSEQEVAMLLNVQPSEAHAMLADSRFIRLTLGEEVVYTTIGKWQELKRLVEDALKAHHEREPLSAGLEMEELRGRLPVQIAARGFRALIDQIGGEIGAIREESVVRMATHQVRLGGEDSRLGAAVVDSLVAAGFQPPDFKQLCAELMVTPAEAPRFRTLLAALEREGKVVKVATDLYFDRGHFERARACLEDRLQKAGEISAATYRDMLGCSRRFAIALLEHFDHIGVTTRVGDVRRARARATS
jgi:selenocysteine-specific elongation factor